MLYCIKCYNIVWSSVVRTLLDAALAANRRAEASEANGYSHSQLANFRTSGDT